MKSSSQLSQRRYGPVLGTMLLSAALGGTAVADPPADASPADAQPVVPKGSFLSSLKQAFTQDFDKEVVRGHFEVGTGADTHRYYCLIDPKTGKSEINGVAAQLVTRHDKMTGVKDTAVSFFSCADAEKKGILVTAPYFLTSEVAARVKPAAPVIVASTTAPRAPGAAAAAVPAAAVAAAPTAAAVPLVVAATPAAASATAQTEVMAAYLRFVAGQNAHDRAMVASVLLDSPDFAWGRPGGDTVWGSAAALDDFEQSWKGSLKLDPQTEELRVTSIAPGVAMLTAPVLITQGGAGKVPATVPARWTGLFVKAKTGWRIASVSVTPFPGWRAPRGE